MTVTVVCVDQYKTFGKIVSAGCVPHILKVLYKEFQ